MFCSIYKWLISQALDSAKPLSGSLSRHIHRCASCREFLELHRSLEAMNIKDLPSLPGEKEGTLVDRIVFALNRSPEIEQAPTRRNALVPVFVSALVLVVIATSIYFLTVPRQGPGNLLASLAEIDGTISTFEDRLEKLDTPLEAEYTDLKQAMKSTTEFFASYLDVKIGQNTE
jgi:hypothetical protein